MSTQSTSFPRTFAATGPLDVKIELGAGHVGVTAADTDHASVTLRPARAGDEDALDLIARSTVDVRGSSLHIEVPRTLGFREHAGIVVDATVPAMSTVVAKTGSADLRLDGTFGDLSIKTGSGDVRVEACGNAKVGTGSGDVSLARVDAAQVKTGSGDVSVDAATGDLTLSTGSGDVRVGESDAEVSVATASGSVDVGTSSGALGVKTASGDVSVRRAFAGEVDAKTASGRVSVGIAEGTAVLLDCSSVTGQCRSGLAPSDGPGVGDQQRLQLRARTVSGNIDVTRSK
jgi:DUF4097 and DUF4098 domain-containing protein YvlB